jgi:AbrB family looped-hinge helix DNA binding protein
MPDAKGRLTYDMQIDNIIVLRLMIDGAIVHTVTISPKFQVVIPKEIRERMGLEPGQKVQAIAHGDRIELIPVRPAREMRGFLRGIDTTVERERDRV